MRVRAACVEYVYQNQQPGTVELLKDLGMDDWDDYKEQMSQSGVYCDFATVEALAFVQGQALCGICCQRREFSVHRWRFFVA